MYATVFKVILILCMFVNGLCLFYYIIVGNRFLEEYARNNWTIIDWEERRDIAAIEQEPAPVGDQLENTTTQVPPGVPKEVPSNATGPHGIGELPVSGYVFDLIFATETALNLASDIMMQVAMQDLKAPGTKDKLRLFLGWNCCSTGVCYLASLFLADFHAKTVKYPEKSKSDEPAFRGDVRVAFMFMYTVVLLVKVSVLGFIFMFFRNWETLLKEQDGRQGSPPGAGEGTALTTQGGGTTVTNTDHSV